MSTYEFQISITPDNYQAQSSLEDQHIPHQVGLGAVESPEPVIIPYDASHPRPPYGSGDEGFNLTFNNTDEFFAWKESEEAKHCVDYFKVDAHQSKAIPPRFLEHVKLACSRHTRSGQKKYEKKYPERQRKTPSKKIEAGCPSFISYKTYVGSPIVKVNYVSQHSHAIGEANLPFTKKYRKTHPRNGTRSIHDIPVDHSPQVVHDEGLNETPGPASSNTSPEHSQFTQFQHHHSEPSLPPSPPTSMDDTLDIHQVEQHQHVHYGNNLPRPPPSPYEHKYDHNLSSQNTSPSVSHPPNQLSPQQTQHHINHSRQQPQQQIQSTRHDQPQPSQPFSRSREASTVSIHSVNRELHTPSHHVSQYHPYHRPVEQQQQHQLAHHQPPQPTNAAHQSTQSYSHPHPQPYHQPIPHTHHSIPPTATAPSPALHQPPTGASLLPDRRTLMQERWTRLENMFGHVRRHANEFEFTDGSVTALEMLLVRLYLESPSNAQGPMHGAVNQHPPGRDQNHNMLP